MMSLLSMKTRVLLILAIFAIVALAVSGVGILSLTSTRAAMNDALDHEATVRYRAVRAAENLVAVDDEENGLLYAVQDDEKARRLSEQELRYGLVKEDLDELARITTGDIRAMVEQLRGFLADYRRDDDEVRKLVTGGDQDKADALVLRDGERLLARLHAAVDTAAASAPSGTRVSALLAQVENSVLRLDALLTRMQMERLTERREEAHRAIELQSQRLGEQLASFADLGAEGQRALARVGPVVEEYRRLAAEVARLGLSNSVYRSRAYGMKTEFTLRAANKVVEQMVERTGADLARKQQEVDELNLRARLTLLLLSVLGLAGASAFGYVMIEQIGVGVSTVRRVAGELADSSTQLRFATQGIARRASEEASSLEETSTMMEQMTASVEQNRSGAVRARELSERAAESARQGAGVTSDAAEAMRALRDASAKVSEISETVSEIAFQTNILALNASVEAARAGEHGRGFTVVATEVRTLAQRSGVAAREISALIRDSLQRIERGAELVGQASGEMGRIVDGSQEVKVLVANISTAAQEQASGITQVTQGLLQLNQVVQANSAQSEELAAAAEVLTAQSRELIRAVGLISGGSAGKGTDAEGPPEGPPNATHELAHGLRRMPSAPSPETLPGAERIHDHARRHDFTGF